MFLDFYQMEEQPFGVTPDPRFLYATATHREALAVWNRIGSGIRLADREPRDGQNDDSFRSPGAG